MRFDKNKTYASPKELVKDSKEGTPDGIEAGDVVEYISEGEHRDEYAKLASTIITAEMQKARKRLETGEDTDDDEKTPALRLLTEVARFCMASGIILGWRMRDRLGDQPEDALSKELSEAMALAEKMYSRSRGASN